MRSFRILMSAAATGLSAVLATGVAHAQTNSLFGSSGPTSSSANRGTTSALGSTQGRTGSSATGLSQGQTGANAFGAQTGQQAGQGGFVGRGNAAGAFVGQQSTGQTTGGRNAATTSTFRGVNRTNTRGTTANRGTGTQNRAAGGGQFGGGQFGGGQAAPQTRDAIRPVTVVAFNYPRHTATRINTAVVTRFARITARTPQFQSISATLNGDFEVVLTGSVDSESTKTLAENLARMEPGVQRVRNQLVVRK